MYRNLTEQEIAALVSNGCSSEDWNAIRVKDGFVTSTVVLSRFTGNVSLGIFDGESGIRNSVICNCSISDGCTVRNVGYLSGYRIGQGAVIDGCGTVSSSGKSFFGNGTRVNVMSETGENAITLSEGMSAQAAFIYASGAGCSGYACPEDFPEGEIEEGAVLRNVLKISDVTVRKHACLEGCLCLEDGTVGQGAHVGFGVICRHFIISPYSDVDEGANLHRCYVGEGTVITRAFSGSDSFFSSNCHFENGEAVSLFAGPCTVSHHKSALLIGLMCSFLNAGSGTNMSNHAYKLGPVHSGLLGRGCKTASNSYIVHPVACAPFTTVMGNHYGHPDTSLFPFSYLVEKEGHSWIVPGISITSCGTFRDGLKWPSRDRRRSEKPADRIDFRVFNPYVAEKMLAAVDILSSMLQEHAEPSEYMEYGRVRIGVQAAHRGIGLYRMALKSYLGGVMADWLESGLELPLSVRPSGIKWCDAAGMVMPLHEIENISGRISAGTLCGNAGIEEALDAVYAQLPDIERQWAASLLPSVFGTSDGQVTVKDMRHIIRTWASEQEKLYEAIRKDAFKEFSPAMSMNKPESTRLLLDDFRAIVDRSANELKIRKKRIASAL